MHAARDERDRVGELRAQVRSFTERIGATDFSGPDTLSVAASPTTGDSYVGESNKHTVEVFNGADEHIGTWKVGGYVYVAIDNHRREASDERGGDVYVLNSKRELWVYEPGTETEELARKAKQEPPPGAVELTPAPPSFTGVDEAGLTVDAATGEVYVAGSEAVEQYNDKGEFQKGPKGEELGAALTGLETPGKSFVSLGVAVDTSTGNLYVVDGSHHVVDEFSSSGEYVGQIVDTEKQAGKPEPLAEPLGVAVLNDGTGSGSGDVYVSDGANHVIDIFGPDQGEPVESGESAAHVTSSEAQLSGELNPESLETEYWFEYGEEGAYTERTATLKMAALPGPLPVGPVTITDLSPGVIYSYRLVAKNAAGETKDTENETFKTEPVPPTIAGETASNITENDATLEAQINPGGEAAYYAEYGTSACEANSCGTKTSGEGFLIGDTQEQGSLELTNLKPNTIYHYWVVATNSAAPEGVHGQAMEFTTPRAEEEVRDEEVERDIAERVNAEAKARAEAEARTAAAGRERQEEAAAAAAKKKQEEAASKSVSITIVKVEVSSSSVTVTLDASQAGTVTISDPGLKTTTKSVAVGNHEIKVLLTKAGKQDRKRHRKILITAKLKAAGRTVSESKTVKL
jgi:hypothetical protein